MNRVFAPLSLLLLIALAGCSSTPSAGAASASPAATAVASSATETASQPASEPISPSEAPTSAPVAGGTATDFCSAVKEIQAVSEAPSGDPATTGAKFQAAAADMRKFAPAEITAAANGWADVFDTIGKALGSGTLDEATMTKALSDAVAGKAQDIATAAAWTAKNCNL